MKPVLRSFAAGVALLSWAAADSRSASAPVTEFFGEISDPAGDSIVWPWVPDTRPAPDLVYASVLAADDHIQLTARFAPGTFSAESFVFFSLDTDMDLSTGWPGTTINGVIDADVLGVDYFVDARGPAFGGKASLLHVVDSSLGFFIIASDIDVIFQDDGLDVVIPLSLIGDDDGRMHFKATVSVQKDEAGVVWPISDWITDADLQPGSTVPAAEQVADLGDSISDLESAGTLGHGPARAISNHLENALRALDAGHTSAARAQLEAFIEQVLDLVDEGTLTEEEAAPLIATALRLLAGL
ncbi:MAG TPA: hypothetical protein VFC86_06795 [Planctomycetota bacterium]|nr:hypothetical protein [Planctomycetota bacterium]